MAVYAIGDVQGCYDALMKLLEEFKFDPADDKLWFAGDLVNRGHDSLAVLRFVKGLGKRAVCVLGNHDLHLLAISQGNHRHHGRDSTLLPVLDAPDFPELMEWLRHLPLMHYSKKRECALLHAGLPPQWDIATALKRAGEVEAVLRGARFGEFMMHMYGDEPERWNDSLEGWDRLRFIVNCLTRLRYCDCNGRLALHEKGRPGSQDPRFHPWYAVPGRRSAGQTVLFGHWSTLGYREAGSTHALDSGCVWGGRLSALKVRKDGTTKLYQVECQRAGRVRHTA